MHTYVHSGTVYNSKDLEPTQMPMDNRLDKENVAYIYHLNLHMKPKESLHSQDNPKQKEQSWRHHAT